MTNDLTTGSPFKTLIRFGIPILLGNLLQQVYNIVDSAIVGQFISIDALAGVGSTGSLNFLVLGFVIGTSTGFGIPMAQSFGKNNIADVKKYFVNALYLSIVISVIITAITLIFIDDILVLMNTNEDMFVYAKTYISTIFAGIIGMFFYNLLNTVLRAVGNSKTPLMFLMASSVLNVLLDLIFILPLKMGVFGAAFATVLSQTCAGIVCFIFIYKKYNILRITKEDLKPDASYIKTLLFMGVPMGLQYSITAVGSVILQSAVNSLGTIYIASISAATRINGFTLKALDTLGLAIAMYTGQNLGAGKIDRITKGVKQGFLIGLIYSVGIFIVILFTGEYLALIFVSPTETEIIANVADFMIINTATYILLVSLQIFRNVIQGCGYSSLAMFAGVSEMIARCFVAFVLVTQFGYMGALMSNPVAWIAANMFLIPAYFYVLKKVKHTHKLQRASH